MREIKFRALRTDNNEWVEGNLINWHEKLEPRIIWFKIEGESISESEQIETNFEVKIDSVGQFTGLKDKNGAEIYEGDIIKYTQHYFNMLNTEEKTKEVKWNFDRWNVYATSAGETNIEVIGNIHANPELLQQQ